MAPAPTLIAGGVLYPPSLLRSRPFVPNLLYANVFTMLPSLPASPAVPPTTTLQQDLPEPPDISNPNPLFPVVDVVFTWVDSTDAKWQASYANATGLAFERGVRWTETSSPDSELSTRRRDRRRRRRARRMLFLTSQRRAPRVCRSALVPTTTCSSSGPAFPTKRCGRRCFGRRWCASRSPAVRAATTSGGRCGSMTSFANKVVLNHFTQSSRGAALECARRAGAAPRDRRPRGAARRGSSRRRRSRDGAVGGRRRA